MLIEENCSEGSAAFPGVCLNQFPQGRGDPTNSREVRMAEMPGSRNRAAWDQDSWLKFRVQSGIPDFLKCSIFTGVVFVFWFVSGK